MPKRHRHVVRAVDREQTLWVLTLEFTRDEVVALARGEWPADVPQTAADFLIAMEADAGVALEHANQRRREARRSA